MKMNLNFGKKVLECDIPDENVLEILQPRHSAPEGTPGEIMKKALSNPIGTPVIKEIVKPGEKVAVITSDLTRPCPSQEVLPPVLEELREAGIIDDNITIIFALGSHRAHTEEEMRHLVGDSIFEQYKCIDHDPSDCINLGSTSAGTPVEIFRPVVEADRRVCVGNIEFHYFAGYSGGAKAIFPGVSTTRAIQANHRMMLDEGSRTGNIKGNTVREDLEEIGNLLKIDFTFNVVLDQEKKIIHAVAGDYIKAHRAGCEMLDSLGKIPIRELADVVIVSAGGFPKDINVYQAQKALDNAVCAVRPGGVVIWVASCKEGLGSRTFSDWIAEAEKPEDLIERVGRDFQLGGHKAAAIAMALRRSSILMVSDLDEEVVRSFFAEPVESLEKAVEEAFLKTGPSAKVIVMPAGGSTLPVLQDH
jgi:nickel-dependent lactate racemase